MSAVVSSDRTRPRRRVRWSSDNGTSTIRKVHLLFRYMRGGNCCSELAEIRFAQFRQSLQYIIATGRMGSAESNTADAAGTRQTGSVFGGDYGIKSRATRRVRNVRAGAKARTNVKASPYSISPQVGPDLTSTVSGTESSIACGIWSVTSRFISSISSGATSKISSSCT